MKVDSSLFITIKNGKFEKKLHEKTSRFKQYLCLDIFGDYLVNFTIFWPKYSRKVQNGLKQKVDVSERNVVRTFSKK
jgi:hypothetical protein